MALHPGVYNLLDPAGPSTSSSAASRQPSTSGPPKAIFLKLSDAAFQQLKATGSDGIPKLAVELASGSNIPTALNIGDSSYTITKRTASPNALTSSISEESLNEVLVASTSSLAKGKGRAISHTTTTSQGLVSLAPPCCETYSLTPGPPRKAVVQKTAENMAERIRERNAQLEREKVGRRVVVVDDDSLLANGKKGKGRKLPAKGPASSASSLLRTSAIAAKRSPSPAGISPRNSPVISATTRAPSRLIANEAAKGLISRKEKEKQQEQAPSRTSSAVQDTSAPQQRPIQTTAAVVQVGKDASSQHKVSEKVRLASSSSSTSSHSSTSSTLSSNPSTSTSISSAPSLPTIKTSPPLPPNPAPTSQPQQIPPVVTKPPPQKYHQSQRDDSDLASASSSSEDESATMPLARRVPSPVKTTAPPLPIPAQQPVAKSTALPTSKPAPAKAASPPRPAKAAVPAPKRTSPAVKAPAAALSAPSAAEVAKVPVQAARPAQAVSLKSQPLLTSASASTSRSSSADRASSSSSSSDERTAIADKSAQLARKRKLEQQQEASQPSVNSSPQVTVTAPEAKKPRRSSGSNGSGGPKTAAKTAGGSRLSRPLPKRSPVQSGRTSPQPPAATSVKADRTSPQALARASTSPAEAAPVSVPPAQSAVPTIAAPSSEKKVSSTSRERKPSGEEVPTVSKAIATVTPPKGHGSRSSSPLPQVSGAKSTSKNLSALVTGTPPTSRVGSPLPSPTSHPLPPKPTGSTLPAPRPSPAHTAPHRSPNLQPSNAVKAPTANSAPPSPVPAKTSLPKPKPLPASLPARPSTIIPPTGSERRDSRDARMIAASELRHTSRQSNTTSSTLPSGTNSGASSPIVSHFPKKTDSGKLSAPSSAANTPKLSSTSTFDKVAKSPATKLESSATKKRKSVDRSVSSDRSAKKQSKSGSTRPPSQSKSEREEGEEAEDEEGEVDAEGESDDDERKLEESNRGRSTEKKTVASSTTDAARSASSKPRKVTDSSSLPSFKKGRAAELLAAEAKPSSGGRSSPVSRADTPISHSPAREQSPIPSRRADDNKLSNVRINTDDEFRDFSRRFTEELFPSYSKLYKRLEEVQKGLSNGRKGLKMTTQDLLKQVEDVNQRGQELDSIRVALARYNDEKQSRTLKT